MSVIKTGLVLDMDFTKGTAKDFSPYGNDGTITGNEVFCRTNANNSAMPTATGAKITVANDSSIQITEGVFSIYADFSRNFTGVAALIDKRNPSFSDYTIYVASSTSIGFIHDAGTAFFTISLNQLTGKKTLTVKKPSGNSKARLYLDGVFVVESDVAFSLTTSTADLLICSDYTNLAPFQEGIYSVMIYSVEKTDEEILEIHNEISSRNTDRSSKRSFKNREKMSPISSGFAWNMDLNDLSNLGPTTAPLSLVGSGNAGETIWGETAIEFNARTLLSGSGYLSGGDISELNFTTESFGGWMWVNIRDLSTYNPILLMKGSPSVAGFHLQCTGGVVAFATSQLGTNQQALGIPSIQEDYWQLVGFFSEAGGNNEVWVNGQEGGFPIARTDPDSASGYNFTIGRHSTSTVGFIDGHIARVHISEYADRTSFLEAMNAELDHVGQNLLYREDFRDAYVHKNFITGTDRGIPGTELITDATASTMRIDDDEKVGKKKLLGGAFASACVTNHIGHPYGTFKIVYDHVSGQRTRIGLYADEPKNVATNHLVIDGSGGANARVEVVLDGVSMMTTAISSVPLGENTLYVVLKPYGSNNCSIYDENWNLLTAATGSNPFTVPIDRSDHQYYVYAPYTNSSIKLLEQYVT